VAVAVTEARSEEWEREIEVKGKRNFFFSLFFTFLGNPPLKSSNPIHSRYTHPPTMNITSLRSTHSTLHDGGGFIVIVLVQLEGLVTMDTINYQANQRQSHPATVTANLPR